MRNWQKLAVLPPLLLVSIVLVQVPVASEGDGPGIAGLVDFRMAPLEQVKKINLQLQARKGIGQALTVMSWDGTGDGQHLILGEAQATPDNLRRQLSSGEIDSVSWHHNPGQPTGTCDSDEECEDKTDEMCGDAGHGGVDRDSVTITMHADGSKTCSGDCESNGAVAFVTCNPQ